MGIKLHLDIDTNLGNTSELYIRVENLQINYRIGSMVAGVTVWLSEEHYIKAAETNCFLPAGQVESTVICFPEDIVVEIPVIFSMPVAVGNVTAKCYGNLQKQLIKLFSTSKDRVEIVNDGSI